MGFMDELKKLTKPYDDEEDFFDGADESFKAPVKTSASSEFENTFATTAPAAPEEEEEQTDSAGGQSIFGSLGKKSAKQRPFQRTVSFGGSDTQVILYAPKGFDDARELVGYLQNGRSVVMTLEGIPSELARRLLDLSSGVALALDGKITPVSAKTYFVTPSNVDVVGSQPGVESDGKYF